MLAEDGYADDGSLALGQAPTGMHWHKEKYKLVKRRVPIKKRVIVRDRILVLPMQQINSQPKKLCFDIFEIHLLASKQSISQEMMY